MSIKVFCKGCNKTYAVKDEFAGKQGKCPAGHELTVPAMASTVSVSDTNESQRTSEVSSDVTASKEAGKFEEQDRNAANGNFYERVANSMQMSMRLKSEPFDPNDEYWIQKCIAQVGETVLLLNPQGFDVLPHAADFLSTASFPGERLCFRCGTRNADRQSTDFVKISESATRSVVGGSHTLTLSGYICVPRCSVCKELQNAGERRLVGPTIAVLLGGIAVLFSLILVLDRIYGPKEDNIMPWVFDIPITMFWIIGIAAFVILSIAFTWFGITSSRVDRELISKGLQIAVHEDVAKAKETFKASLPK